MRKDNIDQASLEKAYLMFSERGGFQTMDYSHTPGDRFRGTVVEPEHVSDIDGRYKEILPADVTTGGKYDEMNERSKELNLAIDEMQNKMRISRERGSFQQLQTQMKEMQALVKEKEAVDAKMAVQDLGRAQMQVYNRTRNQESSYAERLDSIGTRIAAIEKAMLEYTESQGEG